MNVSDLIKKFCEENSHYIVPFRAEGMEHLAVKKTFAVSCYEKRILALRKIKAGIADSKRLAWYMQYTNDKSSKKKWIKRICYLPLLVLGREK